MSSRATLRTRTGCLQYRRRRKKCDEARPRCSACMRNALCCEWPSGGNQPPDGRRRQLSSAPDRERAVVASGLSSIQVPPPVVMPAPFQSHEYAYLYCYFASTVSPRLVRQRSLDQTHMLQLGPQFAPLFGAVVSVAGMQLPCTARWPTRFALQGYLHATHSLQSSLTDITKAGCDDRVLATVILLSVFESCRSDATPAVAPHVTAAGLLLTQRRPREFRTKAAATFDRICLESFLYHASLMMLFDPSLDVVTGIRDELGLAQYFNKPTGATDDQNELVLKASYKFFLLLAEITRLSRLSRPLEGVEEVLKWRGIDHELSRWSGLTDCADISLGLVYLAAQILLQSMNPDITSSERTQRVGWCVEGGLQRIPLLKIESHPPEFLLWPAAILGAVSVNLEKRKFLQVFIAAIAAQKMGGQAAWVQKRLDRIWMAASLAASMSPGPRLAGLRILLDDG